MDRDAPTPGLGLADAAIDLSHVPAFKLAHVTVNPATLIVAADHWSQRLEPRAMQVLFALADRMPQVVGRRELNTRVWGARIVGEDAINRAVQVLRRVAASAPPPAPFTIKTVPRVGYELCLTPAEPEPLAADHGAHHRAASVAATQPAAPTEPARAVSAKFSCGRAWGIAAAAVVLSGIGGLAAKQALAPRLDPVAAWTIAGSATLDALPTSASDVALSPDERQVAYRVQDPRGGERVFVRTAADGGAGRQVSPDGVDARRPVWSPDSRSLAFVAYDPGRPCQLHVVRAGASATRIGECETVRDPHLAWSADGGSLLFGDAPGENGVERISAIALANGERNVLSRPPG